MALSLKRKPQEEKAEGKTHRAPATLAKGKKEHFVLLVGDDGAILVYMEGNTVVRRLFAPTAAPEHTRTLTELMSQHPKATLKVVMDVIDQQYIRQTFPPVSPLSVGGLVQRRLERDFAAEDLTGAIKLGREDTLRKDWIYLLVALANTANFQQWIDLVVEQPCRLAGVYLLPVECEQFIAVLAHAIPDKPVEKAPWQMLISHNKVSGFRIVVLRDSKLTFTRIGQAVGESVAAVLAGNVEQEIQNTIDYIRRLGYNEGAGLEVYAILSAEVRDSIDPKRINASTLNLLSPYDVAEMLGLHQAALAADRFGDVVMGCAISLLKKSPLVLKPAYVKKLEMFYNAKLGLRGIAALLVLAMFGMSVMSIVSVISSQRSTSAAESKLKRNAPTLTLLHKQVQTLGVDINTKSDVAAFYDTIKPNQYNPLDLVPELSKLRRDNVNVDEWQWKGPKAGDATTPSGAPTQAPGVAGGVDNTKYPIEADAKVQIGGDFPDNQTILDAVTNYKQYLNNAIKTYKVVIPSAETSGAGGGKISMSLSTVTKENTAQAQVPTLQIELHGPITADASKATPPMAGGAP